ncbi:TPA: class I SAM-dependent DNA methyltransferase, partial [Legionella pneumophila]|nr:class I SAM-dependent DNA methyltransferase [Legionella pneumophila]
MNIAQIENNISNLINNFSKENYIYDLLLAYGIPKNTITLLKKGKRNLSKRDDQLILKKKILFQEVISEDPHLIIDLIANEKESYRHDPRFIIVTNYKELLAIDTKTKETLDIDVKDFDKNFVFFLPLAGMEKTQHKNENPADVKAAEKMAKIYDEILKENDFKTDEDLHALNVYLSRLLFCFFAEDTGIFDQGIFTNSISSYTQLDGSDLNSFFGTLFEVLNIEVKERYNYPEYLNKF